VEGWTRRYYDAWTEDVQEIETLERWLAANLPADSGAALIHNDYKYDNIVLDPADLARIVAVLDWEMATVGDPLMDLGTTLAYWVEPDDPAEWRRLGFGLTALPGNLTRRELAERYARARGRGEDLGPLVFYYAYGLLKVATIVQQIYYRYRQGHTRDARFAALAPLVKACGTVALRAIERGRIDRLN
jgi:aminoglycoside phosphotransferase (APT) family kinase protein